MNFQQLRIVRETVRRNFNLTEVANALYTAQSGVSKHIKDLEDELGVELFVRRGKRLLGLTEPGKELLPIVERILLDTQNIKRLGEQFAQKDKGHLAIATTHTQARYALPPVVTRFKEEFPKVHLELHQCGPKEIVSLLRSGQVDIGIATEALGEEDDLVSFPFYQWQHTLIVPEDHPLTRVQPLTLEAVAEYPIITYHEGFTGRTRIDAAFARAGITPDIVMSALDADVIKAYVELGHGVGIIAAMAFHPQRDAGLKLLDSKGLFEMNTTWISLRRGHYLRGYALRFIECCSPALTESRVRDAVFPKVSTQ
ncbi:CysB family HTH-type transcriptional regulator [Azoarcus olearius]|uniref:HTH-type transcriptional regulator cbl n=1 Tax=Azoarcus sp. (strain BH72) TaxID=418699 RepID=A1K544_AZOSB|nr:CysB family HTH-type transcriptional regulator [Azoarcus olearius]ANQ84500.1 transcriptional regulator CysB-like protein [Azoarcus olearius]CAL93949.1 putative HTH-type transcriptional regulator cbl [Azoarcus olearius]